MTTYLLHFYYSIHILLPLTLNPSIKMVNQIEWRSRWTSVLLLLSRMYPIGPFVTHSIRSSLITLSSTVFLGPLPLPYLKKFKVATHHFPQGPGCQTICAYASNKTLYVSSWSPGSYFWTLGEIFYLKIPLPCAVLLFISLVYLSCVIMQLPRYFKASIALVFYCQTA